MSSGYSKSGLSEWIITFKPWLLPRIQGRIGYMYYCKCVCMWCEFVCMWCKFVCMHVYVCMCLCWMHEILYWNFSFKFRDVCGYFSHRGLGHLRTTMDVIITAKVRKRGLQTQVACTVFLLLVSSPGYRSSWWDTRWASQNHCRAGVFYRPWRSYFFLPTHYSIFRFGIYRYSFFPYQ